VLLKAGADVNAVGGEYGTALQAACYAADIETVRVLLNAGADVTSEAAICGYYGTALQAAAAVESLEIVQELVNFGAAVNIEPSHGTFGSALSAAATADEPEIAELLLEHGADANFVGGYNHLPIMAAAQAGNLAILKLLLDHGADASGQGGQWGSTITAAAHGNDMECFQLLIERGGDIHAKGGHYGSALQAAALKADMGIIDVLLDGAIELINYLDGKYHTPLTAAAYYDRLEVVNKLLDKGADIRHQGGQFRSAITAAAIKGNKAVLERLLDLRPSEALVDEALVEAVAYRQAASVDLLLQSRANVFARHPTLGSANEALEAPEIVEENSDDEEDDPDDEHEDSEEEEGDGEGVQWVGDDGGAVSDDSEDDSVTDLKLEEDVTEKAKIQRLLEEAVARRKRNPTVERFKSVRHRGPPARLSGYPPPPPIPRLPPISASYAHSSTTTNEPMTSPYGQHSQEPWSLPFRTNSGHEIPAAISAPTGLSHSIAGNTAYTSPLVVRKPVHTESPQRVSSPHSFEQAQHPSAASQAERQHSTGSVSNDPGRSYTPPSRKGSEDKGIKRQSKAVNRRSLVSPGPPTRYQQRQNQPSLQGSMDPLIEHQDFAVLSQEAAVVATPPPVPYSSHPPQQYHPSAPPLPPRQSQHFTQPGQPQPYYQPHQSQYQPPPPPPQHPSYSSPPPPSVHTSPPIQGQQGHGYPPYGQLPQNQSSSSFQNNQYGASAPHASQGFAWELPGSNQGLSGRPNEPHGRRWGNGGYDGAGYGG
jgi:ankyrin repeat protein